ncbi:MAG: hypothetical protein AAGJ87_15115 [Pseudomonadota bacterium]
MSGLFDHQDRAEFRRQAQEAKDAVDIDAVFAELGLFDDAGGHHCPACGHATADLFSFGFRCRRPACGAKGDHLNAIALARGCGMDLALYKLKAMASATEAAAGQASLFGGG